jgi:cold shock CspA family protein
MLRGTVRSFNDISGKGFIQTDGDYRIFHVSYREIKKKGYRLLDEGQKVQFNAFKTENGDYLAKNVKISRKR